MGDRERITRLEIRCEQLQLTVNEAFHWIDILKSDLSDLQDRVGQADRKTENSSEKPNNCEQITEDGVTCAKYPACDDCLDNPLNKVKGSERLLKGKTEPTISKMEQVDKDINVRSKDCETCKHYKLACELFSEVCKYEPITQNSNLTFETDTPQTD